MNLQPTKYRTQMPVHGDVLSSLQYRETDTSMTSQVVLSSYHPTDIELTRKEMYLLSAAAVWRTLQIGYKGSQTQ